MFWKKFGQAQSASKLFNQASGQWRRRQQFLLQEDEAGAEEACLEVIRLCQLSIQSDEKMGDAYVLLSNALSVAVTHTTGPSDPERYEFLQSRAAAVIHLWYSLPHRGYPITKNAAHGERLWRIIVDEVRRDRSLLSEDATITLMESYRDSLAIETISPNSYEKIRAMILKTTQAENTEQPEERESLEEALLPTETFDFLAEILPKVLQKESTEEQIPTDKWTRVKVAMDKLEYYAMDSSKVFIAGTKLLELIKKANDDKDLRQAIGWLTWLFILRIYSGRYLPDSASKEEKGKHYGMAIEGLQSLMNEAWARQGKDYDALLLAAGFCDWVGLVKWSAEIMGTIREQISEKAIADRLREIKREPRMMLEDLLVHRLL